jgi:hypothetical protein
MDSSEGRDDPFSILKMFLEMAPEVVIYDFACSLEEYAMNRDPWWFRDTLFVIDRFHWPNHNAYAEHDEFCSRVFFFSVAPSLSAATSTSGSLESIHPSVSSSIAF